MIDKKLKKIKRKLKEQNNYPKVVVLMKLTEVAPATSGFFIFSRSFSSLVNNLRWPVYSHIEHKDDCK